MDDLPNKIPFEWVNESYILSFSPQVLAFREHALNSAFKIRSDRDRAQFSDYWRSLYSRANALCKDMPHPTSNSKFVPAILSNSLVPSVIFPADQGPFPLLKRQSLYLFYHESGYLSECLGLTDMGVFLLNGQMYTLLVSADSESLGEIYGVRSWCVVTECRVSKSYDGICIPFYRVYLFEYFIPERIHKCPHYFTLFSVSDVVTQNEVINQLDFVFRCICCTPHVELPFYTPNMVITDK